MRLIGKVYISGKVTGCANYRNKFRDAEKYLRKHGIRCVNPVKGEKDGKAWDWYLRRDIRKLTKCCAIVLLPDWHESKGARLEKLVAESLGLHVMAYESLQKWLEEEDRK